MPPCGKPPISFDSLAPQRALPTETKVESGTSYRKSGTSFNLSKSGTSDPISAESLPVSQTLSFLPTPFISPESQISTTGRRTAANTWHRLQKNVRQFRGGLVFKADGLLYYSTLGLRVIEKKKIVQTSSSVSVSVSVLLAHQSGQPGLFPGPK